MAFEIICREYLFLFETICNQFYDGCIFQRCASNLNSNCKISITFYLYFQKIHDYNI